MPVAALAQFTAPKLDFTADQIALARAVAPNAGLASWYGGRGLAPVFAGPQAAAQRAALIAAVETAPAHGLPPLRYGADRLRELDRPDAPPVMVEAAFARSFAAWVHDVQGGVLDPRKIDSTNKRQVIRVPVDELLARFATAADPAAVLAQLVPRDPRYAILQRALADEGALAAPPGTPAVPPGAWREGVRGEGVAALRARLAAIGFASATADRALFDAALTDAVARYQDRAGLPADGVAGPKTIARLNQGRGPRERALMISLERMRWLNGHDLSARHLWVNLPEYSAHIVEGGQSVFQTRVVIGKTDHDMQTPEFSDQMEHVVVNPRWNVPRSITVREYLPRLQANRHAVAHLDIIDAKGRVVSRDRIDFGRYTAASFPYRMRQKPSDDNALGQVKFIFPNPMNIYLHDTPSKGLFNETRRAFSHGCIRVARPVDLAHELLRGQVADPEASYSRARASGKESWLGLDRTLPVHLVYFTLIPDQDGTIRSFPDVYGRDAAVWAALEKAGAAAGVETLALAE
ncbi:L,D-transpeptidase family protein [Paracoccus luteus]|uniref:L,D-transpeptidase family protein n=1 Tax=Paracoccus luteus TaxID=2508543 RepID=UPI00106F2AA8|nr:L,D-transpeptidase family protein [Paracoccus luteus]